jgi:hypothetical protein
VGEGEQVQAGHGHHREPPGLGERLGGADPDPQPGEQAGTDADGDAGQRPGVHLGLLEDPADGGGEHLGVAALVADRNRGQRAGLRPDGHAGDRGGGVHGEHEHAGTFREAQRRKRIVAPQAAIAPSDHISDGASADRPGPRPLAGGYGRHPARRGPRRPRSGLCRPLRTPGPRGGAGGHPAGPHAARPLGVRAVRQPAARPDDPGDPGAVPAGLAAARRRAAWRRDGGRRPRHRHPAGAGAAHQGAQRRAAPGRREPALGGAHRFAHRAGQPAGCCRGPARAGRNRCEVA